MSIEVVHFRYDEWEKEQQRFKESLKGREFTPLYEDEDRLLSFDEFKKVFLSNREVMTREKEIEQAMKESVAETIYASGWGMTPQATDLLECAFTKGAEWADTTMLDKVCEWLKENVRVFQKEDIGDFILANLRKAMKE